MDLKTLIVELRERCRLTRSQLAAEADCHWSTIQKIETSVREPSLEQLRAIGKVFRKYGHPFDPAVEQLLGIAQVPPKPVRPRKVRDAERSRVERIEERPDLGQVAEDEGGVNHDETLAATGTGR